MSETLPITPDQIAAQAIDAAKAGAATPALARALLGLKGADRVKF